MSNKYIANSEEIVYIHQDVIEFLIYIASINSGSYDDIKINISYSQTEVHTNISGVEITKIFTTAKTFHINNSINLESHNLMSDIYEHINLNKLFSIKISSFAINSILQMNEKSGQIWILSNQEDKKIRVISNDTNAIMSIDYVIIYNHATHFKIPQNTIEINTHTKNTYNSFKSHFSLNNSSAYNKIVGKNTIIEFNQCYVKLISTNGRILLRTLIPLNQEHKSENPNSIISINKIMIKLIAYVHKSDENINIYNQEQYIMFVSNSMSFKIMKIISKKITDISQIVGNMKSNNAKFQIKRNEFKSIVSICKKIKSISPIGCKVKILKTQDNILLNISDQSINYTKNIKYSTSDTEEEHNQSKINPINEITISKDIIENIDLMSNIVENKNDFHITMDNSSAKQSYALVVLENNNNIHEIVFTFNNNSQ